MHAAGAAFQIFPVKKRTPKLVADLKGLLSQMNEKRPDIKFNVFSEHVGDGEKKRKPHLQANANI